MLIDGPGGTKVACHDLPSLGRPLPCSIGGQRLVDRRRAGTEWQLAMAFGLFAGSVLNPADVAGMEYLTRRSLKYEVRRGTRLRGLP